MKASLLTRVFCPSAWPLVTLHSLQTQDRQPSDTFGLWSCPGCEKQPLLNWMPAPKPPEGRDVVTGLPRVPSLPTAAWTRRAPGSRGGKPTSVETPSQPGAPNRRGYSRQPATRWRQLPNLGQTPTWVLRTHPRPPPEPHPGAAGRAGLRSGLRPKTFPPRALCPVVWSCFPFQCVLFSV